MILRMWKGWTPPEKAPAYSEYLAGELFPRLERELGARGYRGYDILRREIGNEVEFVTLTWFDSLDCVKAFAGEAYEAPVISAKAASLLARYEDFCAHYELDASVRPRGDPGAK